MLQQHPTETTQLVNITSPARTKREREQKKNSPIVFLFLLLRNTGQIFQFFAAFVSRETYSRHCSRGRTRTRLHPSVMSVTHSQFKTNLVERSGRRTWRHSHAYLHIWFTRSLHRRNVFYTVQTGYSTPCYWKCPRKPCLCCFTPVIT